MVVAFNLILEDIKIVTEKKICLYHLPQQIPCVKHFSEETKCIFDSKVCYLMQNTRTEFDVDYGKFKFVLYFCIAQDKKVKLENLGKFFPKTHFVFELKALNLSSLVLKRILIFEIRSF